MPPEGKAPAAVWRLQFFMAGVRNSGHVFPLVIPFLQRALFPRKTVKDSPMDGNCVQQEEEASVMSS